MYFRENSGELKLMTMSYKQAARIFPDVVTFSLLQNTSLKWWLCTYFTDEETEKARDRLRVTKLQAPVSQSLTITLIITYMHTHTHTHTHYTHLHGNSQSLFLLKQDIKIENGLFFTLWSMALTGRIGTEMSQRPQIQFTSLHFLNISQHPPLLHLNHFFSKYWVRS